MFSMIFCRKLRVGWIRRARKNRLNNFHMLHQSLTDEVKFVNKEMDEAKKSKSESEESKATATGDLDVPMKDLNNNFSELDDLHHKCMTKANDFKAETKSRAEELKALATAKHKKMSKQVGKS